MRDRRLLVGSILMLGVVGVASLARAQDAPPAAPPSGPSESETVGEQSVETARRAREAFDGAMRDFGEGRYVDAIHGFQVAASLIPSADLWFNIASAYQRLAQERGSPSDYEQAIAHFQRYLRDRVDPPDRVSVEATIGELTEQLESVRVARARRDAEGTLRLESGFDGARVSVDGEEVGTTPLERDLPLAPGAHHVEATRDGFLPFRAEVGIETGLTVRTRIELTPSLTHRSVRGQPVVAWILWGAAVASLGATVGLGVEASSRAPQGVAPGLDPYADARTWSAISDAMLGVTLTLVVGGIASYSLESAAIGTESERFAPSEPRAASASD